MEPTKFSMPNNYEMEAPPIPPPVRKLICRSQTILSERRITSAIMKLIDHKDAKPLLKTIFAFLWKQGTLSSGIDVFKLACMNKIMKEKINQQYAPMRFKEFGKSHFFATFM